jgi:hypothetical protein
MLHTHKLLNVGLSGRRTHTTTSARPHRGATSFMIQHLPFKTDNLRDELLTRCTDTLACVVFPTNVCTNVAGPKLSDYWTEHLSDIITLTTALPCTCWCLPFSRRHRFVLQQQTVYSCTHA